MFFAIRQFSGPENVQLLKIVIIIIIIINKMLIFHFSTSFTRRSCR